MPTFDVTPEMMREIIMDHYSSPRHKGKPADLKGYATIHTDSENCIDDFDVYLKVEKGKIVDARWDGVACTISAASTDILCEKAIGLTFEKAHYLITQFLAMIGEKPYDADVLEEALAFKNTAKQAARIHCATMGWNALQDLLTQEEGQGKT